MQNRVPWKCRFERCERDARADSAIVGSRTDAGLVYDAYGRILTLPAADAGTSGSNLTNNYYVNDMVRHQATTTSNVTTTQTWSLDASQRLKSWTTVTGTTTVASRINHFDDASSDSQDWTAETVDATNWTANLNGIPGGLNATVDQTGHVTYEYANLHGDITATSNGNVGGGGTGVLAYSPDCDEYGNVPTTSSNHPRYGWLGTEQRSNDAQGNVVLMGVRLYAPALGMFLSVDPIPGGNATAYAYPPDPINAFDTSGAWGCWSKNCLISKGIDIAMDAITLAAGLSCAGYGPIGAIICMGIVGAATASLGYWLKSKYAGGSCTASGNRRAIAAGFIDAGMTQGIAGTAPAKGLRKLAYTLKQKMWNVVAILAKVPFVGGKLVSAARGALGWIFDRVISALQAHAH